VHPTYKNIQQGDPGHDKLQEVQWLVDKLQNVCMKEWPLEKFLTIHEMTVQYKGSYCHICQYMPKSKKKWGIKY
jgi:hypothetical protein